MNLGDIYISLFKCSICMCVYVCRWSINYLSIYIYLCMCVYLRVHVCVFVCTGGRLGWEVARQGTASMTGGLVQEYSHAVLSPVSPLETLFITLTSMMVSVCVCGDVCRCVCVCV